MKSDEIIRAWKDEQYRLDLGGRADVPANPAGGIELTDEDLGAVGGGTISANCTSVIISIGISNLIHCADSIMHGSCSGFSIGCC
jgi:mersacidin/lichenicidin family type 2 lantibiotic